MTFALDVTASTVTASTVRLFNGRTGAAVPAGLTYDPATRKATLAPATPLLEATPYRIVVAGVRQDWRTLAPIRSVFSTVDLAPQPVGSFDATGSYWLRTSRGRFRRRRISIS